MSQNRSHLELLLEAANMIHEQRKESDHKLDECEAKYKELLQLATAVAKMRSYAPNTKGTCIYCQGETFQFYHKPGCPLHRLRVFLTAEEDRTKEDCNAEV